MSCMAGLGKEQSSVISPAPLALLPQLWNLLASQAHVPCPEQEELYSPLHYLPSQERGNFFSLLSLPIPSSTNSEGTLEDKEIIYKLLSHHLDSGEVFVASQK